MTADLNARPVAAATARTVPTAAAEAHPGDALSRRQRGVLILLLGAAVALGPFTVDMYLPAFPQVAADLDTTESAIQLTLTATMIGFGLGQLIIGPLSDAVGRRWPLLIATSVHVLASVSIIFAQNVEAIMIGRIFQGLGAAGAAVVSMAIVRDLFSGQKLIRTLARMAIVTGLAPVLAPIVGAQVLQFVSWRGVFGVLSVLGLVITILASILLFETLPAERRGRFERRVVLQRYKALLGDRTFVGVLVVGSMAFSSLFSYLSSSTFVLQDMYGLSSQQFAIVFGTNAVGMVLFNQTGARLMRRYPPRMVMTMGLTIVAMGAVGLLAVGLLDLGLVGLISALFFCVAPLGFVMPAVQILALADHPREAGTAASLIGAVNFGLAGVISPLVGMLGISVLAMATVMCVTLAVAHLSLWLIVRPGVSREVLV
ncbi:multidrug effflux MFS transporter [Demequina capsici]|uniref:Multidrug effflux MFS transporter n=1 Tax=Demequina capsici TaxID=3075620 RepID=A0AA96JCM5_9MICO|nr:MULTISPECIES: multidrug effflux MFS transporter [unclassified Demequina]WNM24247.1 multidrug effflux MFS transporter [Demequina sp. OYTSA14]WNM27076.1 multidrug effflux MFS transporter [Demequina sp. PMTSA13]